MDINNQSVNSTTSQVENLSLKDSSDSDDIDEKYYECQPAETGAPPSASVRSNTVLSRSRSAVVSGKEMDGFPTSPPQFNHLQHNGNGELEIRETSVWGGRTKLPVTMISRSDFSVWGFLKQCIGKDLSKITMPISFNEPLSFLQRIVEYAEYSQLLVQAAQCPDPISRHELVAAFAVSSTASNWDRTGKPFNPLLGETYELEREDLRIVCEQVSHHPPSSAFHVESPHFTYSGCIHPKLKFWGASIQITPKGIMTLHLHKYNEVYTWQNIICSVHNIMFGKIWIEHYGEMEVVNHMTKCKAVLNFKPCGWLGTEPHKIQGYLFDQHKRKIRAFYGKWIEALYSLDPAVWSTYAQATGLKDNESSEGKHSSSRPRSESVLPQEINPERGGHCDLNLPGQKLLWSAMPKPANTGQYYNFTSLAMMLNEIDAKHGDKIAPTDCRLRPDMRMMEFGDGEGAAQQKMRLEEKQRAKKAHRKKAGEEFKPRWFRPGVNRYTGTEEWFFTGDYWRRDWTGCEDIF